jgi:nicotinate-nucleotide adenylyltransferase
MPSGTGKKRRIGVLGGTFDPVHNGHLAIAEEAKQRLELADVVFVPAGQSWMKADTPISSAHHRLEMVRLAVAGKQYFTVSTVDIDHSGASYTVDTITRLCREFGGRVDFYFIMGWDSLPELPRWKEPERLIEMCYLVALPRPSYPRPDLATLEKKLPGLSSRVILLDKPEIDISATGIRKKVAKGQTINQLVPAAVAQYIIENKLYRDC